MHRKPEEIGQEIHRGLVNVPHQICTKNYKEIDQEMHKGLLCNSVRDMHQKPQEIHQAIKDLHVYSSVDVNQSLKEIDQQMQRGRLLLLHIKYASKAQGNDQETRTGPMNKCPLKYDPKA